MTERILYAIGYKEAEEYITKILSEFDNRFEVVGSVNDQESILSFIREKDVNVLVIREGLKGSDDIFKIVFHIRLNFPDIRIVFMAKNRKVGDLYLARLVAFSIFDILAGERISTKSIANLIVNPQNFNEVKSLLPPVDSDVELFTDEELKVIEVIDQAEPDKELNDSKNPLYVIGSKLKSIKSNDSIVDENEEIIEDSEEPEELITNSEQDEVPTETTTIGNKLIDTSIKIPMDDIDIQKDIQIIIDAVEKKGSKETESDEDIYGNNKQPFYPTNFYRNGGRQKIITFYGAKSGIGNTVVSLNVAVNLSLKGNRVIFIELNYKTPSTPYWFDMTTEEQGLDFALMGMESHNFQDVGKSIMTKEKLLKRESEMGSSHKKFPPSLDFLFFSENYIKRLEKNNINTNTFKDLLMFLMYQEGYDYVVLDLYSGSDSLLIESCLIFSTINAILTTQDVSSIGYWLKFSNHLKRKGIEFDNNDKRNTKNKNIYITNRYFKDGKLKDKNIQEWLEVNNLFTVPENSKEINDSTLEALPTLLMSRNKQFKESINNITNYLIN